jgi:hypothetical protein
MRTLDDASLEAQLEFLEFSQLMSNAKLSKKSFYQEVDEIKATKLGISVTDLRISEYVDKDGLYFDKKNKTWKVEK